MPSKKLIAALNEQIANELGAHNQYLAVAAAMDALGLKVLSKFFFDQSAEEREHALKFVKYLLEIGADVTIREIGKTKTDFPTVEAAIGASLAHEQKVTSQIHELMAMAQKENDYPTASFLQWFIDEQVEEEATMGDLLQLVKMAGENGMLLVEDRLLRMGVELDSEGG